MNRKPPPSRSIDIPDETVQAYHRDGFCKIQGILTPEETVFFHEEALKIAVGNREAEPDDSTPKPLNQKVNIWTENDVMKALTFHPTVIAVAKRLAGVPLRLWHDHILAKNPGNPKATEWHQDQPFWPHSKSDQPISAWIALCDVPARRGCMSFIPGQHHRSDLAMQDLRDPRSLFNLDPDLEYQPKATLPLRAGDCTFHHGRTPHMANGNETDAYRIAHVVIFVDRDTVYDDTGVAGRTRKHVVTDPLGFKSGDPLEGELFPEV